MPKYIIIYILILVVGITLIGADLYFLKKDTNSTNQQISLNQSDSNKSSIKLITAK